MLNMQQPNQELLACDVRHLDALSRTSSHSIKKSSQPGITHLQRPYPIISVLFFSLPFNNMHPPGKRHT
jgi:hypothetical protein